VHLQRTLWAVPCEAACLAMCTSSQTSLQIFSFKHENFDLSVALVL